MLDVNIADVVIDSAELIKLIDSLEKTIQRHERLRELLLEIVDIQDKAASRPFEGGLHSTRAQGASRSAGTGGRPGTSRNTPEADSRASVRSAKPRGRGRRPAGVKTLKMFITEILQKSRTPLRPGALRDRVLDAGYETTAKPSSFYVAVFNTAKKIPGIEHTKDGFRLGR